VDEELSDKQGRTVGFVVARDVVSKDWTPVVYLLSITTVGRSPILKQEV